MPIEHFIKRGGMLESWISMLHPNVYAIIKYTKGFLNNEGMGQIFNQMITCLSSLIEKQVDYFCQSYMFFPPFLLTYWSQIYLDLLDLEVLIREHTN